MWSVGGSGDICSPGLGRTLHKGFWLGRASVNLVVALLPLVVQCQGILGACSWGSNSVTSLSLSMSSKFSAWILQVVRSPVYWRSLPTLAVTSFRSAVEVAG